MSDSGSRGRRPSDTPVGLRAERETFIRNFLHKGVEFTEELLQENRELQAEIARLENENVKLRSQIASDDAIRDLLSKIETLESERKSLANKSVELELSSRQHEDRYQEVERELNDLASLYIASSQLAGVLSASSVIRHVSELLEQLVGVQAFVLFLLSEAGDRLIPVVRHNIAEADGRAADAGVIGDVRLTGVLRMRSAGEDGSIENPLAAVPLTLAGQVVGVIAVTQLLPHKEEWRGLDRELFKLLAAHAGSALMFATLYEDGQAPKEALTRLSRRFSSAPGVGPGTEPADPAPSDMGG